MITIPAVVMSAMMLLASTEWAQSSIIFFDTNGLWTSAVEGTHARDAWYAARAHGGFKGSRYVLAFGRVIDQPLS